MTTTLPVPIEFELPGEEWTPASPDALGVPHAALLVLRQAPPGEYVPSISISGGLRPDAATLEEIANESVRLIEQTATDVEVDKRREHGSAEAPGLTQLIPRDDLSGGVRRTGRAPPPRRRRPPLR